MAVRVCNEVLKDTHDVADVRMWCKVLPTLEICAANQDVVKALRVLAVNMKSVCARMSLP